MCLLDLQIRFSVKILCLNKTLPFCVGSFQKQDIGWDGLIIVNSYDITDNDSLGLRD
jgi:hypothetical protein